MIPKNLEKFLEDIQHLEKADELLNRLIDLAGGPYGMQSLIQELNRKQEFEHNKDKTLISDIHRYIGFDDSE